MSKLTASELGRYLALNNPGAYIGQAFKRGFLKRGSDKMFDINHPVNSAWIMQQGGPKAYPYTDPGRKMPNFKAKPFDIPVDNTPDIVTKSAFSRGGRPAKSPHSLPADDGDTIGTIPLLPDGSIDVKNVKIYSLQDAKTLEEIRLKQVNVMLNEAKLNTLLGKNIPADAASSALLTFATEMIRTFKDSAASWIIDVCHRNQLDSVEENLMNKELIERVNQAYERAKLEAESKLSDFEVENSETIDDEE